MVVSITVAGNAVRTNGLQVEKCIEHNTESECRAAVVKLIRSLDMVDVEWTLAGQLGNYDYRNVAMRERFKFPIQ